MTHPTILINLHRCTGCWTCSMACKIGNGLADEEWWQYVRTLGSGAGIDRAAGVWPDLHMSWQPIHTASCTLCGERTADGLPPFCVKNCPNDAMIFGDLDDPQDAVAQKVEYLRGLGYQLFRQGEWEGGREEILYASKK